MFGENLAYALVQALHNFGAALVFGAVLAALWPGCKGTVGLAWLVSLAWAAQAVSGMGLGAVSLYFYGRFPDIHLIARFALAVKVASAILGFALGLVFLHKGHAWAEGERRLLWRTQAGLAGIALTGAAFLRWFS